MSLKRFLAGAAAALLAVVLVFPLKAGAVSAKSAVLMDAQTGRFLYEHNADQQCLIASTTKIMTALVVSEQCNVLDRVRIPREAAGIEGSSVYLQAGEIMTVQELLYCLMLHSGNDAAVALAIYCGGTMEGFVGLMNDKARNLSLHNTHFDNPHGLDSPGQYSTARDMARLAAYAMNNPIFYKTVSTKTVTAGNRHLRNHNKLLWFVAGADGVKTGYTKKAGRILVSSATRAGRRLICVTMSDPNDWEDHRQLYTKAFLQYAPYSIVVQGQCLGLREVASGAAGQVPILAAEDFSYPLTQREQVSLRLQLPEFVYAPVVAGDEAGYCYVFVDDKPVGKVSVIFGSTVEMEKSESAPSLFRRLFGG